MKMEIKNVTVEGTPEEIHQLLLLVNEENNVRLGGNIDVKGPSIMLCGTGFIKGNEIPDLSAAYWHKN